MSRNRTDRVLNTQRAQARKWTPEEDARLLRQVRAFPQNLHKCFLNTPIIGYQRNEIVLAFFGYDDNGRVIHPKQISLQVTQQREMADNSRIV